MSKYYGFSLDWIIVPTTSINYFFYQNSTYNAQKLFVFSKCVPWNIDMSLGFLIILTLCLWIELVLLYMGSYRRLHPIKFGVSPFFQKRRFNKYIKHKCYSRFLFPIINKFAHTKNSDGSGSGCKTLARTENMFRAYRGEIEVNPNLLLNTYL